jgi:hypothetical protein
MSKEFAEKNKNKKTPQEIKAEAQAKANVNSNPAPTKSAPKPTQNTTIVKPSQKKAEQVSAQIGAQTSSKSETKATPGMSLSGVKDKAKDYGKQFVEGVKKYATTSKAEKGQESTREKWAREAEEEQYKKSHPIKSIWEEATSGKSAKEVWQDVNPAIKTAGAVALPFLGGLGGAAISAMGLAKTFKDENNREVEIPTLESNDDVIDYYESLPDDNIVKRLVSQESRDNYRAKQQLSERYQEAKDSQMPELLENAGISRKQQGVMGGINKAINPFNPATAALAPGNYLSQKQYLMEQGLSEADADYAIQYMNRNFDNAINDALVEKSGESTLGKIAGSEASVPARLVGSLEDVADQAINYVTGKPLTTDGGRGARTMNLSRGFREEAQKDMGGVGRFLYGTGMSVLDMGAAIALAAATGGGSLVSAGLMGTQKASDVMDEAIKRGLTPDQIIAEGIASGVTTAVTEKIPMGKWEQIAQKGLTEVTAKQVGKMLFASAFPEAIQEMSEDGADLIADWLIAGDKSQINTDIARLMADNPTMSYKEASTQVWKDWAIQTALDGLGGFLSGGVMGGGSLAFNGLMNNNTTEIPGLMDDTQLSETELQELGYSPEEIAQYEAELRGEEMPTVDDAVADLIQNPVEDNVLNDEDILPLDLFANPDDAQNVNELLNNSPVDNAGEMGYGEDTKGDLSYDGTDELNAGRTDERPQRTGEGYSETYDSEGQDARGNQRVFRQSVINDDIKTSYARAKADTQILENVSDRLDEFSERLELARQSNEYGLMVSPKSPQQMIDSGALVFMSENGNSGALVTEDGDIEAVFHIKDGLRRTSYQTIITAIQNGGIKLDCFGPNLVNNYNALGFEAVSMTPWNEKEAPDGWTYGEKDVYAMKLRDGITAEDVIAKLGVPEKDGGFHLQTDEELEALKNSAQNFTDPTTGYAEAMNYRDGLINASSNDNTLSNYQNILPTIEQPESTASFNFDNNATPQNPNNDLASVMDSYVNEQQGNQDITQINPEDTYTSEDVTAEDLNNLENTDDVRERGYSDTVKNKTDAPPELKAAFINDPSLYRELHNSETQARANEIFDNGTLDESLARVQGMIDVKNPVAVPLAYRVSKELVSQGRTEEAVTLTRQLAQALTEAGQFTQAVTINMLNNDPIAGREYLERQIQAMNREGQMRFGDKWNDFSLTDEEIERFNNIDEGDIDAINEAYADVWARIARDYPVRMWDKLQELRRVGLLCNMRTFVRNTASNISMLPLRWNAGRITALAEYAYKKANPEYVRTESGLGRISKESRNLAQELYNKLENELFGEDSVNKYKEYNQATRNVQVFKGTKFDKALDKIITKGANLFINANNATLEYINKTTGGAFDEVMNLYGIENIDSLMNLINQKTAHKDINPSALETIRNFTYYMLGEFGDQPFIKRNFVQKLSSYIEANGIKSIEDIPQDAISLAVQEANKATFHDDSNIAQAIQGLRKDLNKLSGPLEIGNLILTFAKTPGNIGARMIEYSPIGLGKAAIDSVNTNKAIGNLKQQIAQAQEQFDNAQNTQEKLNAQRELEQLQKEQRDNYYKMTQALTLLGQGAEGTLGIAIGWLLNKMGFIVGHLSDDKKKRKYEQNVLNKQETSVQIGGTSYSIDFLQPSLSPVVFGAILSECFDKQTDSFLESAGNAGLTVINSWLESTPMKSFSEMFSGYGTPAENIFNAIIDIPTSWIPSQVGASARIEDRTMRNTYDKTSTLNTIKNEAIAKIPGLSKTLPASYDLWGRERERQDTKGKAMFAQLLNPGTTKSENTTDIDEDILDLYDALNGDARVLPHSAATSYSIGGETHKLNNKEVSEYQKIMGQTSYELAKAYINSDAWDDADDEMKADELDKLYKFAESLAKREVLGVYPQDSQKNLDIYDDYGIDGVLEYFEIKRSINGGMSRIEALDSMQLTAEEKGYYYSKLVSDPSENALAAQEEFGDAGLYYWYSVQEAGNKKAEKYQAIMDSDYDDDVKKFLIEKTYNDGRKNPVPYDEIDFDDINKAIQEIQPADPLSSHRNNNGYNLNSLSDNNEVPFLNRGNNNNADKGRLNLGAKPGVASLSNQESQTSEIPTLDDYDSKMITNGNAWVDAKSAIPYLDNSDMSDAQKGKILYENGKVSEKEQKAYDKGNYQGVKKYYDIKYYGDADGNGNIKKQELIDYLVGQGASKNEVNTWLDIYGFKANYNG